MQHSILLLFWCCQFYVYSKTLCLSCDISPFTNRALTFIAALLWVLKALAWRSIIRNLSVGGLAQRFFPSCLEGYHRIREIEKTFRENPHAPLLVHYHQGWTHDIFNIVFINPSPLEAAKRFLVSLSALFCPCNSKSRSKRNSFEKMLTIPSPAVSSGIVFVLVFGLLGRAGTVWSASRLNSLSSTAIMTRHH